MQFRALTVALRSLRRTPSFTIACALTLAIGLGATTSIFTVLNAALFRPLPFANPSQLAGAWMSFPAMGFNTAPQSLATYFTFRRLARSIEGIAVVSRSSVNISDHQSDAKPARINAAATSASLFSVLGMPLQRGRPFTESEDTPNNDNVVIISDALWRTRYGTDPSVIGRKVAIEGRDRQIIGIARPDFQYPDAGVQLWVPIALDSNAAFTGAFGLQSVVRLKPGVTLASAETELKSLVPRSAELYPNIAPGMTAAGFYAQTRATASLHPLRNDVVGNFNNIALIAAAAGTLLLLVAIANVASLLLTRSEGRRRELAVRVALGARPLDVASLLFAESLVLSLLGGVCGFVLAIGGARAFVRWGLVGFPRLPDVSVGPAMLLFSFCATALTAALCTILPALRFNSKGAIAGLRDESRGGTASRDRQRARRTLVVAQVAFATALVAGAGLLFRSFERLREVKPGFEPDHALTFWLSLPTSTYRSDTAIVRLTSQLIERVGGLPGVTAVGASSKIPLWQLGVGYGPLWREDQPPTGNALPPSVQAITATGGYFRAMGIPMVTGRTFEPEIRQREDEAIIDRTLAMLYWHDSTGAAALGHRLHITQSIAFTVVGVVGSVRDTSLSAPPNGIIYLPNVAVADSNNRLAARTFAITLRTSGDPRALMPQVQRVVAEVDRTLPVFRVLTMREVASQSLLRLSLVMGILAVTAFTALALVAVGLYGVLAYMVSLRRREIGVRLALGASPSGVVRLISGQGAALAAVGIVVGSAIFLVASKFLHAHVFGVGAADPLTIAAVSACLMAVAIASSWIPARRASRIDPASVLTGD